MTDIDVTETKFYKWLLALPSVPLEISTEQTPKQKGLIKLEYISPDKEPITKNLLTPSQKQPSTSRSSSKPRPSSPVRDEGIKQRLIQANKPLVQAKKAIAKKTLPPKKETIEKCAVCLDTDIKQSELLKCGHAVCLNCLPQLHKPICPVCQRPLAGKTVSADILNKIKRTEQKDKEIEERANLLAAVAYQMNPSARNIYGEVYQRYH